MSSTVERSSLQLSSFFFFFFNLSLRFYLRRENPVSQGGRECVYSGCFGPCCCSTYCLKPAVTWVFTPQGARVSFQPKSPNVSQKCSVHILSLPLQNKRGRFVLPLMSYFSHTVDILDLFVLTNSRHDFKESAKEEQS